MKHVKNETNKKHGALLNGGNKEIRPEIKKR